jgi:hypothetical protein
MDLRRHASSILAVIAVGATLWSSCILNRDGGIEGSGSGAGGAGVGGAGVGGFGGDMPCGEKSDCGADTACASVDCVNGTCESSFSDAGTPCSGTSAEQIVCDGMGSCVECAFDSDCTSTCVDGELTGGEVCTMGQCDAIGGPVGCEGFACNAEGTDCLTSCDSPGDCVEGYYCEPVTSKCETPNMVGQPCSVDAGCESGFCVDEFCCDTICNGDCEACASNLTTIANGTCAPIPFGDQDPDTNCIFGYGCGGDGTCIDCGEPTVAPQGGACPMATCNGGCNGDTCIIDCTTASSCEDQTINCPAGWDCQVNCQDGNSCKNATLNCPPGRACDLDCNNQSHSCQNIVVNCDADGPCSMICQQNNGDHCDGAEITCGGNSCTVNCIAGDKPAILSENTSCNVTKDADCN